MKVRSLRLVCLLCLLLLPFVRGWASDGEVWRLTLDGVIGPATADYVGRGISDAAAQDARLIVLQMDTPGGLDSAMRDIVQDILASPVPVVTWVAPSGARAASAGTYILYASHIAAMAPGTNLGAATPVQVGGGLPGGPTPDDKGQPGSGASSMERKMVNDAVAYIRGLATLRGRNAEWAEAAVRSAASLPVRDARQKKIIDVVAADFPELLKKIDGHQVALSGGKQVLRTDGLTTHVVTPDWRNRILSVITDPNIAYILMLIGIYGLFFEFASPGYVLPGVAGAICLLLALYAFQVLPVNYAGMGLLIVGIMFMLAEAFVPSFGALGIGGVIAFVIGSIILFERGGVGYEVSIPLIGALALTSAGFFVGVMAMVARVRNQPVVSGEEEMRNSEGEALDDFLDKGRIRVHGEIWWAESDMPVLSGQRVRVKEVTGLTLKVEPIQEET